MTNVTLPFVTQEVSVSLSNSRGISLLTVVGKNNDGGVRIMTGRVLIKRVRAGTECAIEIGRAHV